MALGRPSGKRLMRRKLLEMVPTPQRQVHQRRMGAILFHRRNRGATQSILPKGRHISRTLALVSRKDSRGAPWFPITMIYQLVVAQAV